MKKIFMSFSLIIAIFFTQITHISALSERISEIAPFEEIQYPNTSDFEILKKIFEEKFYQNTSSNSLYSQCIYQESLCITPFYTEIDKMTIQAILNKNFYNHQEFFEKTFGDNYIAFRDNLENIKIELISNIPEPFSKNNFQTSFITEIIGKSFYQSHHENSILETLKNKILDLAKQKCRAQNQKNQLAYCHQEENFKKFYPTEEDFWKEKIYNGNREVALKDFSNIIEYKQTENNFELKYKKENYTLSEAKQYISDTLGEKNNFNIKDYSPLLQGQKIPEIPNILKNIPHDTLVIYIKNPNDFFEILKPSNNIIAKEFGINIGPKVQIFLENFFEKNISEIKEILNHEFVILIENADFIEPHFAIISEQNIIQNKKIISNNPDFEKKIQEISKEKTLQNSSDFHYAWMKKGKKIEDIFVFAGDNFFAKLLEFETFVQTRNNIIRNQEIINLQNTLDAYFIIHQKFPNSISELFADFYGVIPNIANNYEILDGKIIINSQKTTYHQDEINAYIFMREGYSEIWRSNLDPMGIVINAKNNEIDIDFFMTPVPNFAHTSLEIFEKIFKNNTKTHLAILNQNTINKGFLTLFFGIDLQKAEQQFQEELTELYEQGSFQKKPSEIFTGEMAMIISDVNEKNPGISIMIEKKIKISIKEILENFSYYNEFSSILKNFEEYNGRKIYIFNIFFPIYISDNDNFLIISLSQEKIKELLETKKSDFQNIIKSEKGTFFAINFQEKLFHENLKKYLTTNQHNNAIINDILKKFLREEMLQFAQNTNHSQKKHNERQDKIFEKNFGNIKIYAENNKFFITDGQLTEEIFIETCDIKISDDFLEKIIKNILNNQVKLLEDFFFSLYFGDDEIGFKFTLSDENKNFSQNSANTSIYENSHFARVFSLSVLATFLAILALYYSQNKKAHE